MSDILIKNMKMPVDCLHCGFSHMASDCLKIWIICKPKDISVTDGDAVKEGRPDWCPLIEVPTPHGRLIDADALKKKWLEVESRMGADKVLNLPLREYISNGCVYDLDQAPTIIEAEGTEE